MTNWKALRPARPCDVPAVTFEVPSQRNPQDGEWLMSHEDIGIKYADVAPNLGRCLETVRPGKP